MTLITKKRIYSKKVHKYSYRNFLKILSLNIIVHNYIISPNSSLKNYRCFSDFLASYVYKSSVSSYLLMSLFYLFVHFTLAVIIKLHILYLLYLIHHIHSLIKTKCTVLFTNKKLSLQ